MKYLPVFFDLHDQPVLVVGGGEVALRKVEIIERTGARLRVVAPAVHPALQARAADGRLQLAVRPFVPEDLDGVRLAVVATSERATNHWVASLAEARSVPVNVVDDLAASRFIVPAIIDRDPVLVAVSTAGTSPVLARRLRERLETLVPQRLGEAALWLQALRKTAKAKLRDVAARRRYFETLIDGPAWRRFMAGDTAGAEREARQLLETSSYAPRPAGEVTLVGAGPGDPELLTIKALRALQDADVILYDRLVSAEVLDLARRDAERICVGKAPGSVGTPQEEINRLLVEHAQRGRRVVRLKGGDPFTFGRGGEELEALAAAQIDFSVIPGITAAAGCAAYAGIPLTHRDHAHSVSFVTGHADATGKEPDWRGLAVTGHTAVFYMGLKQLPHIVAQLRAHGAPAARPAALIANGTRPDQRVVTARLDTLVDTAARAQLGSPVLLVVGEVVGLHQSLAWFGAGAPSEASRSA